MSSALQADSLPAKPSSNSFFISTELRFSRKLSDYGVTVPCSTDSPGASSPRGVGPAAVSAGSMKGSGPPSPLSHSGRLRVARGSPRPEGVTLQPGRVGRSSCTSMSLCSGRNCTTPAAQTGGWLCPGASVEWQEDFQGCSGGPCRECVYTGVSLQACQGQLSPSATVMDW